MRRRTPGPVSRVSVVVVVTVIVTALTVGYGTALPRFSVDSSKIAPSPSTVVESKQGIQLDQTVRVGEDDIDRSQEYVSRASVEMGKQLHHFAGKDPGAHYGHGLPAVAECGATECAKQRRIVEQGEVEH